MGENRVEKGEGEPSPETKCSECQKVQALLNTVEIAMDELGNDLNYIRDAFYSALQELCDFYIGWGEKYYTHHVTQKIADVLHELSWIWNYIRAAYEDYDFFNKKIKKLIDEIKGGKSDKE